MTIARPTTEQGVVALMSAEQSQAEHEEAISILLAKIREHTPILTGQVVAHLTSTNVPPDWNRYRNSDNEEIAAKGWRINDTFAIVAIGTGVMKERIDANGRLGMPQGRKRIQAYRALFGFAKSLGLEPETDHPA